MMYKLQLTELVAEHLCGLPIMINHVSPWDSTCQALLSHQRIPNGILVFKKRKKRERKTGQQKHAWVQ